MFITGSSADAMYAPSFWSYSSVEVNLLSTFSVLDIRFSSTKSIYACGAASITI